VLLLSVLNGLIYGLLLFMLSSGLTLIFSMMGVLNFAHASLYMLGAYFAYQASVWLGFWPALALVPFAIGAIGALIERFGLRSLHGRGHIAELLLTFGLAYVIGEAVRLTWGNLNVPYEVPRELAFPLFELHGQSFPAYRAFMAAVSLMVFAGIWLMLKRTRIGLIVQASLTHPAMVSHLGHDTPRVFMLVFAVGSALAGLAGVIGGNYLVTEPGMAESLGAIVFVVVVVGGLGSLGGALIASLLIGVVQSCDVLFDVAIPPSRITLAQVAPLLPYLLLVFVMAVRPRGLMGTREA
jgi:branched-chain amino acid transport system permease protein